MHARVDPEAYIEVRPRRRWGRLALMLAVPLLIVAGGLYYWLAGANSVSTDNAYVQQDKVSISADVTGRVLDVPVHESQRVAKGAVLIRIDPEPFRIALARAEADLASARLQVTGLREGTTGMAADVAGKREAIAFARQDMDRQQALMRDGFTTRARLQAAQHAMSQAQADLAQALSDEAKARTAAGSAAAGTHPLVLAAMAARDKAALDLRRTTVFAPSDGIVSQTAKVQPGQIIALGIPTMSLVVSDRPYVEANFKETDLEHMRVGQPARVRLDAYPSTPIEGRVLSIGAGTGSEFSVLPAQNATGNWVKVTQRVPVRIALPAKASVPLIAGLSAKVTVETGAH